MIRPTARVPRHIWDVLNAILATCPVEGVMLPEFGTTAQPIRGRLPEPSSRPVAGVPFFLPLCPPRHTTPSVRQHRAVYRGAPPTPVPVLDLERTVDVRRRQATKPYWGLRAVRNAARRRLGLPEIQ